ncbi:hypothetical protein [Isoptericola dokdonensis]|uniref:Uncharacterized protein n=1 Tax=Isoptericola dokdonensis DS-3 TaxID=1300344 RepID=A0A161ILM8_9MICO|nr:hypothetical protein [Isoptericola dokdonensis]ANC31430.1 hypothetical protein I598_1882 [Isoptericola dokdonensis DS-3]
MSAVDELLQTNDTATRKWGTKLLALEDYNRPVPDAFFTALNEPVLPATARQLGFITTDGITQANSISSESTQMDQQLEPVRTDMTGIEKQLTVAFGESSNAWVNAVLHGKRVADFAEDPHSPWLFHDGDITDYPYYRLWVIAQDGVGDNVFYRVEYAYRAKVTATTDRTLARANPENIGFTFGLFKDPIAGRSLSRGENGPGFLPPLATSATAGTPGVFLPNGSSVPADFAALQASSITANPTDPWTTGQFVELEDDSHAYWDGSQWASGEAA